RKMADGGEIGVRDDDDRDDEDSAHLTREPPQKRHQRDSDGPAAACEDSAALLHIPVQLCVERHSSASYYDTNVRRETFGTPFVLLARADTPLAVLQRDIARRIRPYLAASDVLANGMDEMDSNDAKG